jgi:hypothetical protein
MSGQTFTSVDKELLMEAFLLAHVCSRDERHTLQARKEFKIIASKIWRAHGEDRLYVPEQIDSYIESLKAKEPK